MGAADKEGHKLNVPLFVLSQLHFTVATIGFALWHLMIISDLECWPSLTQSFWCRPGRPFTFSSPPEGRANFTNLISLLRESKVRCSVLAYMVCLAATTMAWRLCMLTSQWAVCIFSRLANLLCLCFLVVFSVLLIRLIIRKPNISSTPLFALAGNIFGLGKSNMSASKSSIELTNLCSCSDRLDDLRRYSGSTTRSTLGINYAGEKRLWL